MEVKFIVPVTFYTKLYRKLCIFTKKKLSFFFFLGKKPVVKKIEVN